MRKQTGILMAVLWAVAFLPAAQALTMARSEWDEK